LQKFFLFGNSGALSIAEIYKLTNIEKFLYFSEKFAVLDFSKDEREILRDSGGTIKAGKVFEIQKFSKVLSQNFLREIVKNFLSSKSFKKKKINFGVSFVGNFDSNFKRKIKESIKFELSEIGIKSRFLENKTDILATATLKFNKILEEGFEIVLIKSGENLIFGETTENQDIDRWSKKDFERPERDTTHGLLQPKIARIMLNLSRKNLKNPKILDPSCGSGTILQEGLDLNFDMFGSDIDSKSVEFSKKNLLWFLKEFDKKIDETKIFVQDIKRDFDKKFENFFDAIVSEPFMGSQISKELTFKNFLTRSKELIFLYSKSFETFSKILKRGGVVVFAFPLTLTEGRYKKLNFESKILGKNFKMIPPQNFLPILSRFRGITERGFVFGKNDQFVQREIVVFEKL